MKQKARTVQKVPALGLCTGCGTCAGMCPEGAIEMCLSDTDEVFSPRVGLDKCTECGICVDVCPGIGVDFGSLNQQAFGCQPQYPLVGVFRVAWVGHSTDQALRVQASSGGAVTELCSFALDEGLIDAAVVTNGASNDPLRPEVVVASTRDDLIAASGSKYSPVPVNQVLRDLRVFDGRVALVGLPCHIQGIRKAMQHDDKLRECLVYVFGLACGGVTSPAGTECYLLSKGIRPKEVRKIRYRGEGWPGKISVGLKDGSQRVFSRRYSFGEFYPAIVHNAAFGFQHFRPWRCLTCCDRAAELADLSFSDPYLSRYLQRERMGQTLIVARSEEGQELVEGAARAGRLILERITLDEVIRSHQGELRLRKAMRPRFWANRIAGKGIPKYSWAIPPESNPPMSYILRCFVSMFEHWMGQRRWMWPLILIWSGCRTALRYTSKAILRGSRESVGGPESSAESTRQ